METILVQIIIAIVAKVAADLITRKITTTQRKTEPPPDSAMTAQRDDP